MKFKVDYTLTKRHQFYGVPVGTIAARDYDNLTDANIPNVGDELSIQHGPDAAQVISVKVAGVRRTIMNDHESYWVAVDPIE